MQISATSPTRQRLGRIAAVSALALLLTGSVATPAGAMKRSQVVGLVNNLIGACFASGGDPYVAEGAGNGVFAFACYWDDGSSALGQLEYEDDGGGEGDAPVRGRAASRSAHAGEAVTADDASVDAVDHGRQKTHKQQKQKHKAHASKHGHKHRR